MSGPPPEGYLGADARIGSAPAPELVEAGYRLELEDAPLLHRGLGLADLAHVTMLGEQGAIPAADLGRLLWGLLDLLDDHVAAAATEEAYGDLANVRERRLEQRIGTAAGWLNAGRPRREAGRIAFRLALRPRLLDLVAAVARFADSLVALAARERDTLMADYTYAQVAQPTTVGHWSLSFAYPALRDLERLRRDFTWVDRSPGGAGGVNGSRFPLDRDPCRRAARLPAARHAHPRRHVADRRPVGPPRTRRSPRRGPAASRRTSSCTAATSSACCGSATSCAGRAR